MAFSSQEHMNYANNANIINTKNKQNIVFSKNTNNNNTVTNNNNIININGFNSTVTQQQDFKLNPTTAATAATASSNSAVDSISDILKSETLREKVFKQLLDIYKTNPDKLLNDLGPADFTKVKIFII